MSAPSSGDAPFDVARHNDVTYQPPAPWNEWDDYAGCWVCRRCGAAAGFQFHAPGCKAALSSSQGQEKP